MPLAVEIFGAGLLRALLAAVAFVLVLGPPLDSLARETPLTRAPTAAGRLIAAFDATDNTLNHGRHKAAAGAHHIAPATSPQAQVVTFPTLTERALDWRLAADAELPGANPDAAYRPPRS
ncbi:hypothetical protein [Phenylobacterium sp.]|uniref:hypothetical protein n=1 Tax=Phenylobacterium sp. TaxID=1871053 RepID=UPI00391D5BA9